MDLHRAVSGTMTLWGSSPGWDKDFRAVHMQASCASWAARAGPELRVTEAPCTSCEQIKAQNWPDEAPVVTDLQRQRSSNPQISSSNVGNASLQCVPRNPLAFRRKVAPRVTSLSSTRQRHLEKGTILYPEAREVSKSVKILIILGQDVTICH